MQYYAAPMEGLTDRVWRQVHQRWFGGADRYYAPFLSPPENRVPVKKKMAELAPEANPGAPVIPQLLGKDGSCAAWMIGVLRQMGYSEVNLNFGCPSGTVTAKGKGAGMLRDLKGLDRFLYAVFDEAGGPISVKTRIGVERPEEFGPILEVYNRYPLAELIIHPRVMRQLYRGEADRDAFAAALPACRAPVCYNGDITSPAGFAAFCRFGKPVARPLGPDGGPGTHRRPRPPSPGAGRGARLQRGAAGLLRRALRRLRRRLWQPAGRHQPDEGLLARSHRPLRGGGPAGQTAEKAARPLGVRGDGGADLRPAAAQIKKPAPFRAQA